MRLDFDDIDISPQTAHRPVVSEDLITRLKYGFLGLAIVSIFGVGITQAFSPQARQIRSELQSSDRDHTRQYTLQQQQQRHTEQSRQIAEQRYQDGCLLVYAHDEAGNVISLWEGMTVVDSITNQPLAQGTVICDPNGATSVLEAGGVVEVIATTPDTQMVQEMISEGKIR